MVGVEIGVGVDIVLFLFLLLSRGMPSSGSCEFASSSAAAVPSAPHCGTVSVAGNTQSVLPLLSLSSSGSGECRLAFC